MSAEKKAKQGEKSRLEKIRERRGNGAETQKSAVALQVRRDVAVPDQSAGGLGNVAKRIFPRQMGMRWVSGFLSLALGFCIVMYANLPLFRVSVAETSGLTTLNNEEISYYAGLRDTAVYTIDPNAIERALLRRFPEIREVKVSVDWPASVKIQLEQRVPVLEWDFGGSRFWMDAEGTTLKENASGVEPARILANSFPGAKDRDDRNIPARFSRETVQIALHMTSAAPQGKRLYFTYDNGYGWDTDQGYRLYLGKNDVDLAEKLTMAQGFAAYFEENEIEPAFLSLEFRTAPYYRLQE